MTSRRRLPHLRPEDRWLFLTWHLHGSLPHGVYPPPGKLNSGRAFVWMDRHLDQQRAGPLYLRRPVIAQLVTDAIFRGVDMGHYHLGAFVIMANHVHVLVFPLVSPSELLRGLKGVTAYEANRVLNRAGERFWQRETYDHWVRDEAEFWRIVRYIENNPVLAGFASRPEDYLWSSANERWRSRLVHWGVA